MTTSGSCFMSDDDEKTYNKLYGKTMDGLHNHSIFSIRHTWKEIEDVVRKFNPSILTKTKTMQPFEIKVTIPIVTDDIFKSEGHCRIAEIGIVSVERAIIIRDAINRQLNGLKATAPKEKKAKPAKKTAKKK